MEFDYTSLVNQSELYLAIAGTRTTQRSADQSRSHADGTISKTSREASQPAPAWMNHRTKSLSSMLLDKCGQEKDYHEAWALFERAKTNEWPRGHSEPQRVKSAAQADLNEHI